jgi:hypothetical protein
MSKEIKNNASFIFLLGSKLKLTSINDKSIFLNADFNMQAEGHCIPHMRDARAYADAYMRFFLIGTTY